MASLQIPFTKWDWPSSKHSSHPQCPFDDSIITISRASTRTDSVNSFALNSGSLLSFAESTSSVPTTKTTTTCQSSNSYLSSMLLEGQAVLSHQLKNGDIWLFVGLCNGSIWKWTIKPEEGVTKLAWNSFFIFFVRCH